MTVRESIDPKICAYSNWYRCVRPAQKRFSSAWVNWRNTNLPHKVSLKLPLSPSSIAITDRATTCWIRDTLKGVWSSQICDETIDFYFELPADAMMFKLRWAD